MGQDVEISTKVSRGLAAMLQLGESGEPPKSCPRVCQAAGIPLVTKRSLKKLFNAGLVTLERGVGGGYILAKRRSEITLAEIVAAIDGPFEFPLDNVLPALAPVSGRLLSDAVVGFSGVARDRLAAVTLSDLA